HLGLAVGFAAWGWSANSPYFASILFVVSLCFFLAAPFAFQKVRPLGKALVIIVALFVFVVLDIAWINYALQTGYVLLEPLVWLNGDTWMFDMVPIGGKIIYNLHGTVRDEERTKYLLSHPNDTNVALR